MRIVVGRILIVVLAVVAGCSDGRACRVEVPAHLAGTAAPSLSELRVLLRDVAARLEGQGRRPEVLIGRLRYLAASVDSGPESGCRALRDARAALDEQRLVNPADRTAVALLLDLSGAWITGKVAGAQRPKP